MAKLKLSRCNTPWCNGNTAPFGGVIHGSNPCGVATTPQSFRGVRLIRSLFLLRLDLGQCFPVLQFSFEYLHERVSKSIEDGREYIRARMLECARKWNARAEPIFRVVADDMGEATQDGLPDKAHWILDLVCRLLLEKKNVEILANAAH